MVNNDVLYVLDYEDNIIVLCSRFNTVLDLSLFFNYYTLLSSLFFLYACMAINVIVQYNGGLLPDSWIGIVFAV